MPYQDTIPTFGSAVQSIARMVGHPVPADPAGASDPAVLQMGAAINVALGEMLALYEWQDLVLRATIDVIQDTPGQKEKGFDLPADYYRLISQTEWSESSMLPAGGPLSFQAWQAYVVRNYAMQFTLYWQIRGDQIWFLNPPSSIAVFHYMYLSKGQVIDGDDNTIIKNIAEKNNDLFKLDGFVITLLGRVKYLEWKGFDASAAMRDFLTVFGSRTGADKSAPVLNLSRGRGVPMIDPLTSVPDTGYGS